MFSQIKEKLKSVEGKVNFCFTRKHILPEKWPIHPLKKGNIEGNAKRTINLMF